MPATEGPTEGLTEGPTQEQRAHDAEQGFVRLDGFATGDVCRQMLDRGVELAHAHARSHRGVPGFVLPEANLAGEATAATDPEDLVSKIFKLHGDTVFAEFARSAAVTGLLVDLIGPRLDCFLSQFVFKNPGAWGQPWHQDSFYFPFDPPRPIVGVWLAVTEATLENGCLHVVPGSHCEPVHEARARPPARGQLRLRRDHRRRHGHRRAGADGPRRPAAVRQPLTDGSHLR